MALSDPRRLRPRGQGGDKGVRSLEPAAHMNAVHLGGFMSRLWKTSRCHQGAGLESSEIVDAAQSAECKIAQISYYNACIFPVRE